MKNILYKLWKSSGSMNLTVYTCLALVADLGYGYLCIRRNTGLFSPMNDIGILEWIETYGINNLPSTIWFFILILLLTLLGINTFTCTTDRILALLRVRKNMSLLRFLFSVAPHVMHYAVMIILSGYLCSYLFSSVTPMKSILPGMSIPLDDSGVKITLQRLELEYFSGKRMPFFQGYAINAKARMIISDGTESKQATLVLNHPIRVKGYTIFLKDFSPHKKSGGMKRASDRIDISIRKDYGVYFYMSGILLFMIGLSFYIYSIFYSRLSKKDSYASQTNF